MSRTYEVDLEVKDVSIDLVEKVTAAANAEWPFQEWHMREGVLSGYGICKLSGGETEEEFADRLSQAIWKSTGTYLEVSVNAFYLEDLPCEMHVRGREEYDEWKQEKPTLLN